MTLTADWIDTMLESGIPAEQVLSAVRGMLVREQERAAAIADERAERKREGNRIRQARFYDRHHRRPSEGEDQTNPNGSNGVSGVKTREEREAPKRSPAPPKTTPPEDSPSDPKGSSAPKGANRQRGTRIPDDFASTDEARGVCAEMGLTGPEVDEALAEFSDYWRGVPGVRGTKLDWPATLRNRLREIGRRRPSARASPQKSRSSNGFYDLLRDDFGGPDDQRSDPHRQHLRIAAGGRH